MFSPALVLVTPRTWARHWCLSVCLEVDERSVCRWCLHILSHSSVRLCWLTDVREAFQRMRHWRFKLTLLLSALVIQSRLNQGQGIHLIFRGSLDHWTLIQRWNVQVWKQRAYKRTPLLLTFNATVVLIWSVSDPYFPMNSICETAKQVCIGKLYRIGPTGFI